MPVCILCFNRMGAQESIIISSSGFERLFKSLPGIASQERKKQDEDSVISYIHGYASSDTVFDHRFSGLRYLGQITSPDSLLKIVTWNLNPGQDNGKYFCFLVKRSEKKGAGRVWKLAADYKEAPPLNEEIYFPSSWYGALYYDIRPFVFEGRRYYILLGIDYGNQFITRKIIDVLGFGKEDEPVLGLKCFADGKDLKSRIIFEYSFSAVMSLKFEADSMIVFDHLSPVSPEMKGNRQFYGPDFSFDSFNFEDGFWRLKSDIDIRNK